jgi:hypothetical protein
MDAFFLRTGYSKKRQRLGVSVPFSDCLFITEDRGHIAACRKLGMSTLRFDNDHTGEDFSDWSEAPLLIAHLVAPESMYARSSSGQS